VPQNALPNYLSAADYFKGDQIDLALRELAAAESKSLCQDFSTERAQDDEEAYAAAGRPAGEAKLAANLNLKMSHLMQLKALSLSMVELANTYRLSGDETERLDALNMTVRLGQRLNDQASPVSLITGLVGIAIERAALDQMDPESHLGASGQTVDDRRNQLIRERASIRELNQQASTLWEKLSDPEWASYMERVRVAGERQALSELVSGHSQQ
jgi:hypothetical protein